MSTTISIVIPVLNEEANIENALSHARKIADEVIVVDGGSSDRTLEIVGGLDCTLCNSSRGRGQQLHAGALCATGEILLFLHADTWLPPIARTQLLDCWEKFDADKGAFGGCFEQQINDPRGIYRWIENGNRWRAKHQKLPYGDQGIFVSRELYDSVGGMPQIPLMEDFEFSSLISKRAKLEILPGPIHVDVRRWEKVGPIRQTVRNWLIALRYRMGASPETLKENY